MSRKRFRKSRSNSSVKSRIQKRWSGSGDPGFNLEPLESRLLLDAAFIDVTTLTSTGYLYLDSGDTVIVQQIDENSSAGSGVWDPFYRLAGSGNNTTMDGYNYDTKLYKKNDDPGGYLNDVDTAATHTHPLSIYDVPKVIVDPDGVPNSGDELAFYELGFDLNENQNGTDDWLSLDQMQIFLGNSAELVGYEDVLLAQSDTVLIFDMDADVDESAYGATVGDGAWVGMAYLEAGSGRADYGFYIPATMIDPYIDDFSWVYLYSSFGEEGETANPADARDWGDSDGFEEWNVRQVTEISGHKFHDLNGDGLWGDTEPALEGWSIELYLDDGDGSFEGGTEDMLLDTKQTAADGSYTFTGLLHGNYWVREVQQTDWVQATENPALITIIDTDDAVTEVEYPGLDFGNYQYATKSGYKFHDLDADGVWDAGEAGLAGWTIQAIDGSGAVVDEAVTDADGYYEFSLAPGSYTFAEVLMADWYQSYPAAPGTYTETLVSQQSSTENNFGNYQYATKSGYKFHDLDADGVWDAGEAGLAGWTIQAIDGSGAVVDEAVTDADGYYEFSLAPGSYTFAEVLMADWYQSYPAAPGTYTETLVSQQSSTENNFGNYQYATKSGYKFHDLDADGVWDAGEAGLAGWTIQAIDGSGAVVDTAVTDADGYYEFSLAPGSYTFAEVLMADWYQSYPAAPGSYTETLVSQQSSTENNFGNYQYATKSGYKFHDLDADGVWDAGEAGLAGWTIQAIDGSGAVVDEAVTDADGYYEFSLAPGSYTFAEVLMADWYQSYPAAPGTYTETLVSQQSSTENNFGNYQYATKSGYKFHDLDADGVWDAGEAGLAGWTIQAIDGSGAVVDTAVTDADGYYEFSLAPGSYTFAEVLMADWYQSYPAAPGTYTETLVSQQSSTENNFGNYQYATKSGYKFHDLDADGVWDAGEAGLAGWTIQAIDGSGAVVDEAVTDADGYYEFSLAPGSYTFAEVLMADWYQSYPAAPGTYTETLVSQQSSTENNFGNYQYATKSGYKFHDLDADGVWDAGEAGLAGWTIQAIDGSGAVVDEGVTDADGYYEFSLAPGSYTFAEVLMADWYQSYPAAPGTYTETLVSQQSSTENNFGNYQYATKSGYKFHDLDADGVWDAGEAGLAGWTIQAIDGSGAVVDEAVTDADGYYEFSLAPGSYTFAEVLMADWYQSYPAAPGSYTETLVSQQSSTENNFGNYQYATKSGMKFEDLNGNGILDAGEPGLEGWEIYLIGTDGMGNQVSLTVVTDANGEYLFEGLTPGSYTVSEEDRSADGWHQSYPALGEYQIILTSGMNETGNDFGNWQEGSIHGYKFEDIDISGSDNPETPEPRLEGWTIFLDSNGNGLLDAGEQSILTDINGEYEFVGLAPGTYVVREVLPVNTSWYQTTLGPADIILQSGQEYVAYEGQANLMEGQDEVLQTDLAIGNYLPRINARTPGFWHNNNGADEIDRMIGEGIDVWGELIALNLRNEDGTDFDPTTHEELSIWLTDGKAKNMSYMLSVQLAAMKLNVLAGFVNEGDVIMVDGSPVAIGDLMAEADDMLGMYDIVRNGKDKVAPEVRSEMALLKSALDAANNNLTWFVSSSTLTTLGLSSTQIGFDTSTNYIWKL